MSRRAKPAKAKVPGKADRTSPKRVRDLEKRLAEARQREAEALKRESDALERQTATSEILRVISSSPTDVQPVFDTIVRSAVSLCDGLYGGVSTFDGEMIRPAALHNYSPEALAVLRRMYPMKPNRQQLWGRAILSRTVAHLPDVLDDPEYTTDIAVAGGMRAGLAVPMLREGHPIGAILVTRRDPGEFSERQIELLKTFADQAVIAIENVRLFNETKEALERQTATSEILGVISSSPTDLQPVFDAIAATALRLCDAKLCTVFRFDGDFIHLVALQQVSAEGALAYRDAYPARPGREGGTHRAILTGSIVHIRDIREDPEYELQALARANDFGCVLSVPMLRDGRSIGAITVGRVAGRAFWDAEIQLLKTFADQAVIAIENVRLFTELQENNRALTKAHAQVTESLEQQVATSEILRVISSSPTDVQPVFDAVAESAARLCDSFDAAIWRRDGDSLRRVAHHGPIPSHPTLPLSRGTSNGRAVLEGRTVHVADLQAEADEFPEGAENARRVGHRTILAVPLMREGVALGTIQLRRTEVQLFTERQVALLQTFADQAVIAIENVRLFKELQTSNRDLTQALEQQTATSELLKVIGRSTFDLKPVFETLAENGVRLCEANRAFVFRFDGQLLRAAASYGASPELIAFVERNPITPGYHTGTARAALERRTVHIHDVAADPEYTYGAKDVDPFRTVLGIPILRAGELLGVFMMFKVAVSPFTDAQISLMETFADQAAIAIENARLLTELQARTAELTQSVEKLTALGEISRAVSSTLDVETVLGTIVSRATQLAGADGCAIYEYDEPTQAFHVRATHDVDVELVETLRVMPLHRGEGVMGRATEAREPIQIADIAAPGAYESHIRDVLIGAGYRALLSVPLLREEEIIGSLSLNRKAPGEFPPEVIEVLKTFATQSALAIQNARLFQEIADKSRQLEIASQHKSAFLANMSHELRTPLNAILGFSEVLAQGMFGPVNEKQTEYLRDILESGRHLLSLINDILDLSKIEAGRMELELSAFDLPQAIQNALTLIRERALRRGIALHHDIDEHVGQIQADERKVKQVLLNLLSNAIKFTPEGGRIEVRAAPADGRIEVSVADTGIGIAPEDLETVFEEFRQVGTVDKKAEGTGLGLTLARKFIELHGGRIAVKSEVGRGSTFTFSLPTS